MPEVDLFVVHWNQPALCIATVAVLCQQGISLRVTVIDNDSGADAYEQLQRELDPSITIVRLDDNKGWGGALNVILRHWLRSETNPYCLISAHDAMPEPDCLRLLVAAADEDPRLGIACPNTPNPLSLGFRAGVVFTRRQSCRGRKGRCKKSMCHTGR